MLTILGEALAPRSEPRPCREMPATRALALAALAGWSAAGLAVAAAGPLYDRLGLLASAALLAVGHAAVSALLALALLGRGGLAALDGIGGAPSGPMRRRGRP